MNPPAPFILAVPAKGRLQQNAESFFARAGLELVKPRGARDYRGAVSGFDGVEVAYLSAAEITQQLGQGAAHLRRHRRGSGSRDDPAVGPARRHGDGARIWSSANVVVAVPQAWIDVRNMADLDDVATAFRLRNERKMRLATKYANLTRGFFAEHGVVDYRIVESHWRHRRRAGRRHCGNDRRHHHDRRHARRQWAQGDRRRRDPPLAGQSRRRARGFLERGATRYRPAPARPHRRAKARRLVPRSALTLCRLERHAARHGAGKIRCRSSIRRPDTRAC